MLELPRPRIEHVCFCGLVCLAFMLRAGVLWVRSGQLGIERDAYLGIAANLAQGHGFCTPGTAVPTAYRPPLYPVMLASGLSHGPASASTSEREFTVAFWNLLAGLATVLFVERWAAMLQLGVWRFFAALLVAVDPLLLYVSVQPMTETVFTALVTAWLWAVTGHEQRSTVRSILIGLMFGLAALCRPTIWPLAALMAIAGFTVPPATRRGLRPMMTNTFPVIAGVLIVVSPWVIRNQLVFGRPIFTTTHGGYTLFLANNPVYYREVIRQPWSTVWSGESLARWQADAERRMTDAIGPNAGELARDAWMSAEAKSYIVRHPREFFAAMGHRIRSLWSIVPRGEGSELPDVVRYGVAAFYTLEFVLAAFGIVSICRRREWGLWLPSLLLLVAVQGVHLVYWTDTRMRAPLEPVLAVLAARACRRGDPCSTPPHHGTLFPRNETAS